MKICRIKNNFKILFIFISGILLSQLISIFQIYLSSQELLLKSKALLNLDYIFYTPAYETLNSFLSFKNCFLGGLFFTFTTGAFLSLIAFFAGIIFLKLNNKKLFSYLLIVILSFIFIFISKTYIQWLSVLIIVFFITIKIKPSFKIDLMIFLPVLAAIFSPLLYSGNSLFLDVRDKVLLTNSYGKSINDFYYNYTLFPAEIIKSLKQKRLKTFCVKNLKEYEIENFKKRMQRYNFFYNKDNCDLKIEFNKNNAYLYLNKSKIMTTDKDLIFYHTKKTLNKFYKKTDNKKLFKSITLAGFLIAFPITAYFFFFYLINLPVQLFLKGKKGLNLTSFILFFIFLFVIKPVFFHEKITDSNFAKMISSNHKFKRLDALKFAFKNKKEVKDIKIHLSSDFIPERYWGILNFKIKSHKDLHTILKMTKDDSLNIRCKAYEKLSDIRNNRALKKTAKMFLTKDYKKINDWYVQWYAYNLAKKLNLY